MSVVAMCAASVLPHIRRATTVRGSRGREAAHVLQFSRRSTANAMARNVPVVITVDLACLVTARLDRLRGRGGFCGRR
jgi:hypothetical protein